MKAIEAGLGPKDVILVKPVSSGKKPGFAKPFFATVVGHKDGQKSDEPNTIVEEIDKFQTKSIGANTEVEVLQRNSE